MRDGTPVFTLVIAILAYNLKLITLRDSPLFLQAITGVNIIQDLAKMFTFGLRLRLKHLTIGGTYRLNRGISIFMDTL